MPNGTSAHLGKGCGTSELSLARQCLAAGRGGVESDKYTDVGSHSISHSCNTSRHLLIWHLMSSTALSRLRYMAVSKALKNEGCLWYGQGT